MSTDTALFRKKALSRYLRVDAPGAIVTITPPWTVAVFGTMALLFVALVLFATLGRAQVAAEGRGVVRPDEPPIVLRAPFTATVLSVAVSVGAREKVGQLVLALDARAEAAAHERCVRELAADRAELASLEKRLAEWNESTERDRNASMALVLLSQNRTQREKTTSAAQRCDAVGAVVERSAIKLPVDATVTDLAVAAGSQVHEGDILATLVPARARVVGYIAVGEAYRSELSPGQPVRVKFDALPYDEVGAGSARVTRLLEALPSGVKIDSAPGASVFAELALDAMPAGSGPPRSGMTFTADVLTRRRQVLGLLFGTSEQRSVPGS